MSDALPPVPPMPTGEPPQGTGKVNKPVWKRWWFWVAAVLLLLVIVAVAGGGDSGTKAAKTITITVTAPPSQTFTSTTSPPPSQSSTTSTPPPAPSGSVDDPVPLGNQGTIGKWEITVIKYTPDADAIIANENMFNAKPKPGNQYVLVTINAKFSGNGKGNAFFDLSFAVVNDLGVVKEPAGEVLPNDLANAPNVPTGTAAQGNIDFEVKKSDVNSLVFYAEESISNKTGVFFALKK